MNSLEKSEKDLILLSFFLHSFIWKKYPNYFLLLPIMYKITREIASQMLHISTRSIDRYIRSWKLRSKKDWKTVYIHQEDINNFLSWENNKQEIIIWNIANEKKSTDIISKESNTRDMFDILRRDLYRKNEEIKWLYITIWKMEEVVKNSISIIEYKKSQFLLEESKNSVLNDLKYTKQELEWKITLLEEERKMNYILFFFLLILFIWGIVIWFIKI